MPGYGGQLVALDVNTPAETQSALADASLRQSEADFAQQDLPTKLATAKSQLESYDLSNQKTALDLQVARQRSQNQITGLQQEMIANAMATFDPDAPNAPDRWDEMIDKLVSDGAPQAAQFRGRYSPETAQRWAKAYAATSPSAALSEVASGGASPESGLAGVGSGTFAGVTSGADVTNYDRLFAQSTPEQLQQTKQHLDGVMAAVARVKESPDPVATFKQEAATLGYSQVAQMNLTPTQVMTKIAQLENEYGPADNYLTARLGRQAAGMPSPKIPAELKNLGGNLVAIDQTNPAAPTAKTIAEGAGKYQAYTDAQGNAWAFNNKSGQFEPVENGPKGLMRPSGTGGRQSVYGQKYQAWLDAHPGDTQGALDYAGGRKGMTAADITKSAIAQATRDYQAISLTGPPVDQGTGKPADPQTWINNRAREIAGELNAANGTSGAPGGAGGGSGGQPPPAAVAKLKEGVQTTFRNGQTWMLKNGKPVRVK